jgi:hypothetical protein
MNHIHNSTGGEVDVDSLTNTFVVSWTMCVFVCVCVVCVQIFDWFSVPQIKKKIIQMSDVKKVFLNKRCYT